MVENVLRLRLRLQSKVLVQYETLADGHVTVEEARPVERVVLGGAEVSHFRPPPRALGVSVGGQSRSGVK